MVLSRILLSRSAGAITATAAIIFLLGVVVGIL